MRGWCFNQCQSGDDQLLKLTSSFHLPSGYNVAYTTHSALHLVTSSDKKVHLERSRALLLHVASDKMMCQRTHGNPESFGQSQKKCERGGLWIRWYLPRLQILNHVAKLLQGDLKGLQKWTKFGGWVFHWHSARGRPLLLAKVRMPDWYI